MKAALSGPGASSRIDVARFPFPLTLTLLANLFTAALIDILSIIRNQWVRSAEARSSAKIVVDDIGFPPASTSSRTTHTGCLSPRSEASAPLPLPVVVDQAAKQLSAPRRDCMFFVAMGVMQGLSLGAKNEALLMLSVSTRTMIMATNVLVVMLIAAVTGMEKFGRMKLLAAFLVALGGFMQGISHFEGADGWAAVPSAAASGALVGSPAGSPTAAPDLASGDQPLGYLLVGVALVLDSSRWVLLQNLFRQKEEQHECLGYMPPSMGSPPSNPRMQALLGERSRFAGLSRRTQARSGCGSAISKLRMVSSVMWSATPVMLLLSLMFEPGAIALAVRHASDLTKLIASLAVGVMGINVCEFGVVQWTSAVTFTILSNLHSIPMVVSGILCFGEQVDLLEVLGFCVCILGSLLYSRAKSMEARVLG